MGYSLAVPFIIEGSDFVDGVNLGMAYIRLKRGKKTIKDCIQERTEEQYRLMASRCGYGVKKRRISFGWVMLTMVKGKD